MDQTTFDHISKKAREALKRKLFFISGSPKSGTTWIQKALDSHPEISCAGEGHFFNIFGHFLKQSIELYTTIQDAVKKEVYEGSPYYNGVTEEDFDFLLTAFVGMMLGKRKIKKSAFYLGDKTPANALALDQIHSVFPEAKFIHIYRDGRDVAVSTYKHETRIAGKSETFSNYIEPITIKWLKFNEAAFEFGKKNPDIFFAMSYEELKADFTKNFPVILSFLGVDSSENIVRKCAELSSFEALSGGRKPGEEDDSSFYRKGMVGDWKNYFSNESLEKFNALGGKMMKQLGYE